MNNIYKIKTQNVPDDYGMEINFVTGAKKKIDAVAHTVMGNSGVLSIRTKENLVEWILLSNVLNIEYDMRFTKIMEAREEKASESQKEKQSS